MAELLKYNALFLRGFAGFFAFLKWAAGSRIPGDGHVCPAPLFPPV